jgi:hypothetical protein
MMEEHTWFSERQAKEEKGCTKQHFVSDRLKLKKVQNAREGTQCRGVTIGEFIPFREDCINVNLLIMTDLAD